MPPSEAGQIATVLVAFAVTDDSPSQIRTGNDNSVPPPATELIMPATNAAPNATAARGKLRATIGSNHPAYNDLARMRVHSPLEPALRLRYDAFMARLCVFHWKAADAEPLLQKLRSAGHQVDYSDKVDPSVFRAVRQSPPDAFVIDLSRLPSHGREMATFLRGTKATRHIPIVFVNGDPEKVETIRQKLPDAVYTSAVGVRSAIHEALTHAPASPVVPQQMMDRYKSRSAAQKLGIRENSAVALLEPPRDYAKVIGELPPGATLQEHPGQHCSVTLWFVRDTDSCLRGLPSMRSLAARTKLWILWRKHATRKEPGITQQFLRESAAELGLVDFKICSVNETWSAMLFARRQ